MTETGSGLSPANLIDTADGSIAAAARAHCLFERAEGDKYVGSTVEVEGSELLNFGSCSYLGLDQRPELRQGAVEAIGHYGTQFSFSRAYLSCPLYEELESLLSQITDGHTLVTASTSLAHIAALPALIRPGDAAVIDKSSHASLHTATALLAGIPVKPLRHHDMEALTREVEGLSRTHKRVWYLLDGLYSMLGDFAPLREIQALYERIPNLHLYIDDAHAMSWCGRNGRGFALDQLRDRSRAVVAVSLNKAFSAGGGALVVPDEEALGRVRRSGPMVFAGPVQPPMLGAAVASAKLHLEPEFASLQSELMDRIRLTIALAREHDVPLATEELSPIFFVICGTADATFSVARALRTRGIYVNISVFPAVPTDKAGIRFTVSVHNSADDIERLVQSLAEELRRAHVPSSPPPIDPRRFDAE